jgi:hypothetical protein
MSRTLFDEMNQGAIGSHGGGSSSGSFLTKQFGLGLGSTEGWAKEIDMMHLEGLYAKWADSVYGGFKAGGTKQEDHGRG